MKKLIVLVTVLMGFSFMALAAEDANGTWKATLDTPNGALVMNFALKTDGDKLTGTMGSDMMGSLPISEGKFDGEKISFTVTTDMGVIRATGSVKGDTMQLTMTVGDGQFTFSVNAGRTKT